MSHDVLNHNFVVRISQALRGEIDAAAERDDISAGQFVRTAIKNELKSTADRALDPFADLPAGEGEAHLIEALTAMNDPEHEAFLHERVSNELQDVLEIAVQAANTLDDIGAHMRLERVSGHLRQASLAILMAASRVKAMRARRAIEAGELDRMIERLEQGGADGSA